MTTEQIIEGAGRLLLRLAPVEFRDAWRDEIVLTLVERCRSARQTGGRVRMLVMATLELVDIGRSAVRAGYSAPRSPLSTPFFPTSFPPRQHRSQSMSDDVRHAMRRLKSRPGTSIGVVCLLALAIGLTTAMFTVVDALFLRPVPFRDAEQLASVSMGNEHGGSTSVSLEVFRAWRGSPAFDGVEAASAEKSVIETGDAPITRGSAVISPGLFSMLGVQPIRGRVFSGEDGREGVRDRVIISEDLWRHTFGGAPDTIGRTIQIDGGRAVIVGVMPSEFRFPAWNTEVWRPFDYLTQTISPIRRPVPIARFSATMPAEDALKVATSAAHAVDASTSKLFAWTRSLTGSPFSRYYEHAVALLTGAVALVFLVLCANVSSLLLGRFGARRREFTLCSALGASRARLLWQSAMESTALGMLGSALGVGLAYLFTSGARVLLPVDFLTRTLNPIDLDGRALGVAALGGIVATLAAGWLPAWFGTRFDHAVSLRAVDRSGTESRGIRALARLFLVAQVAFACTLLVASALLVHSFVNFTRVDLGFDPHGILAVNIGIDRAVVPSAEVRAAARDRVSEELRSLPGVRALAWSAGAPMTGTTDLYFGSWVPEGPGAVPTELSIEGYRVDSDFFDMYRIRLLAGRGFQPAEDSSSVILGARAASTFWPGANPVGRTLRIGKEHVQVIGVVNDIRRPVQDQEEDFSEIYMPRGSQSPAYGAIANLKCDDACPSEGLVRARLIASVTGVTVYGVDRLDEVSAGDLAQPRALAAMAIAFAAIALVAAAAGLFSILSQAVARRRREFGVRAAIGASPAQIRGLVLREGVGVAAAGMALGSVLAWFAMRAAASVRFGVSAADPTSWIAVLLVLIATIAAAALRPTLDAGRVNPVELLRDE